MSRTPPPPSSPPPSSLSPAMQAAAQPHPAQPGSQARAELRMRAVEQAAVFRRPNTSVEELLANADKLFAWVIDAPTPAAPRADKNSGDPS